MAPGAVRIVVPFTTARRDVDALTRPVDVSIVDLDARRVADSRHPAEAVLWLTGTRPGRPGRDWYALFDGGAATSDGPFPAPDPGLGARLGATPRWVRPPAGVRPLMVSRGFLGLSEGDGVERLPSYVVVYGPPDVASAGITSATPRGDGLRIRLRRAARLRPGSVVVHDGWIIGRAVAVQGDRRAVDVRATSRYAKYPAGWWQELAGGGLDATLVVEAARAVGDVPPRTGDAAATPPPRVRDLLGPGRRAITGDIVRGSRLRVLSATVDGTTWGVWEALTARGNAYAVDGPRGTGGGEDCLLAPNARVIRGCAHFEDEVAGRVAPSVVRVEVRQPGGSVRAGVVQNGWFLAVGTQAPGARIVALDAAGNVLGTTSG